MQKRNVAGRWNRLAFAAGNHVAPAARRPRPGTCRELRANQSGLCVMGCSGRVVTVM